MGIPKVCEKSHTHEACMWVRVFRASGYYNNQRIRLASEARLVVWMEPLHTLSASTHNTRPNITQDGIRYGW